MPITPFHFGPGLLLKSFGGRHVSWVTFALANLLIDVEPVACYLVTGQPIHPYVHTWLGALLVGVLAAVAGRPLGEVWLRLWNRQLSPAQRRWLGVGETIAASGAWSGALLGSFSHVALDSIMHADIAPWRPFAPGNGLWQLISVDALHWLCVALGVWGALRLAAQRAPAHAGAVIRRAAAFFDLLLVTTALAAACGAGVAAWVQQPAAAEPLDAAAWRAVAPATHYGNPRWRMAQDALARLQLERPGRSATLQLLGAADGAGSPSRLSYQLGFPGRLSMDPYTLDVEFAADNRFLRAAIVQH